MNQRLSAFLAIGDAIRHSLFGARAKPELFPARSVRLVSPFQEGSGPDVVAHIVADCLAATWKHPVVVDALPGDNGFLAIGVLKPAAPTGYDLLVADVGHLSISPSVFKSLPYDPKADFSPVGGLYRTSFFIVVGAESPIRSVKDLVATAAANRGKVTYGSNSVGGPIHLGAAQVESVTGTKMSHVPYQNTSELYEAVSTGAVDWAMGSLASTGPLLRAGKLRLVAIADDVRSAVLPDVPTFEQSGGRKNVIVRSWVVVMAPKATRAATITFLNRSLNDVLGRPEVVEKFASYGFVPYPIAPVTLASLIESETVFYSHMVRRTGANADCTGSA